MNGWSLYCQPCEVYGVRIVQKSESTTNVLQVHHTRSRVMDKNKVGCKAIVQLQLWDRGFCRNSSLQAAWYTWIALTTGFEGNKIWPKLTAMELRGGTHIRYTSWRCCTRSAEIQPRPDAWVRASHLMHTRWVYIVLTALPVCCTLLYNLARVYCCNCRQQTCYYE